MKFLVVVTPPPIYHIKIATNFVFMQMSENAGIKNF